MYKVGVASITPMHVGMPSNEYCGMQVALLSPYVQREVLQQGNGVSQDRPIILPNKVCWLRLALQELCLAIWHVYQV